MQLTSIQRKISAPDHTQLTFDKDVRESVESYFRNRNLSSAADWAMVRWTLGLCLFMFVAWLALITNILHPAAMLGVCVLMGLGYAGMGLGIGHDALHGAYSKNVKINEWVGMVFEVIGANHKIWKISHNSLHHAHPNVPDLDEDLMSADPFIRMNPKAPRRRFHRFQHYYAWPLYALATLNWVFIKDFKTVFLAPRGSRLARGRQPAALATMVFFKMIHLSWSLIIPLLVIPLPWWQILIGYIVFHFTAGLVLGVVFQLGHIVEPASRTQAADDPDDGFCSVSAALRSSERSLRGELGLAGQLIASANFAPRSGFLHKYLGGINFQIEHHLFPLVCSTHYPAISNIVKRVANEHGLPYHQFPTLRTAVRSHFRLLRRMGACDAW